MACSVMIHSVILITDKYLNGPLFPLICASIDKISDKMLDVFDIIIICGFVLEYVQYGGVLHNADTLTTSDN